ncbi:MAG: AI-2E family transporter [Planctomycetia bacterium]|nr:AI-2E family transporter [Planctomycetia bacterium]
MSSDASEPLPPVKQAAETIAHAVRERDVLRTTALCLAIAAGSWYLLREFAPVLRPLLLAVFLCYIILPLHHRLRQSFPGPAAIFVLAGATAGGLLLLALLIFNSAADLTAELPQMVRRGGQLFNQLEAWYLKNLPPWLNPSDSERTPGAPIDAAMLRNIVGHVLNAAADAATDAVVVAIYLLFLLLEARRLPGRIQHSFATTESDQILTVVRRINDAMATYLWVKVKASLVLAVPVTLVLLLFGIHSAVMWGVLTFLLNFIPYLGSVIACSAPILLAFIHLHSPWQAASLAVVLVTIHMLSAYVVEPAMTGKAVGLSPLVILISLAFWGLCWGLTGMLLAVPLTVMLQIVLDNVALTRPFARLMGGELS